jgi:hypothetical protein
MRASFNLLFTIACEPSTTWSDANGRLRRFHKLMTERGFAQLLSHDTLKDSSNGYLVDDTCVFGVEVFVIKGTCRGETLSMVSQPQTNYFTWRFDKYTTSKDNIISSEQFTVEGRKWYGWLVFCCSISLSITPLLILLVYNIYLYVLDTGSCFSIRRPVEMEQDGTHTGLW